MTRGERDPALQQLFAKIARDRGFGCDAYKESCLRRRIAVRMRARGVHEYEAYGQVLDADPTEYDRLIDALTINVTKFYRNREMWDVLVGRFLPELWRARQGHVRAWSAGCASGEEPYTLAMLLRELSHSEPQPGLPRIDATDLDVASLARAASGAYQTAQLVELPPALKTRYFTGTGPHHVTPGIREAVRFRHLDVLREPPLEPPYDLIMCRNVVIYFDRPTQERLFQEFVDAIVPGGLLVLGKVETLVGPVRERLALEDVRERVYRRL